MKKYIPDLITAGSLASGMIAVLAATDGRWNEAVGWISLAVVLDGMDGKIARRLRISNPHGELIDSLADICSFGFAPAVVFYLAFDHAMIWSVLWLLAIAFRLIRFDYIKRFERVDTTGRRFSFEVGLASPWCALLLLVPVVLCYPLGYAADPVRQASIPWLIAVSLLAVAPVPVSFPFRFRSRKATYFGWLLSAILILFVAITRSPWHAFVVFSAFVVLVIPMSGVLYLFLYKNKVDHVRD